MDDLVKVEVQLTQPAKIDGVVVMPTGKPIMVTPDIRDELRVGGAVASGDVSILTAEDPGAFLKAVVDEAEKLADLMVQDAVAQALSDAEIEADALLKVSQEENQKLIDLLAEADARAVNAEISRKGLEAELEEAKAKNTEAAKTTSKKGAAPKG